MPNNDLNNSNNLDLSESWIDAGSEVLGKSSFNNNFNREDLQDTLVKIINPNKLEDVSSLQIHGNVNYNEIFINTVINIIDEKIKYLQIAPINKIKDIPQKVKIEVSNLLNNKYNNREKKGLLTFDKNNNTSYQLKIGEFAELIFNFKLKQFLFEREILAEEECTFKIIREKVLISQLFIEEKNNEVKEIQEIPSNKVLTPREELKIRLEELNNMEVHFYDKENNSVSEKFNLSQIFYKYVSYIEFEEYCYYLHERYKEHYTKYEINNSIFESSMSNINASSIQDNDFSNRRNTLVRFLEKKSHPNQASEDKGNSPETELRESNITPDINNNFNNIHKSVTASSLGFSVTSGYIFNEYTSKGADPKITNSQIEYTLESLKKGIVNHNFKTENLPRNSNIIKEVDYLIEELEAANNKQVIQNTSIESTNNNIKNAVPTFNLNENDGSEAEEEKHFHKNSLSNAINSAISETSENTYASNSANEMSSEPQISQTEEPKILTTPTPTPLPTLLENDSLPDSSSVPRKSFWDKNKMKLIGAFIGSIIPASILFAGFFDNIKNYMAELFGLNIAKNAQNNLGNLIANNKISVGLAMGGILFTSIILGVMADNMKEKGNFSIEK